MHGDVVGFVALDFVLRLIFARMMGVALTIDISHMHFDNLAGDMPSLGIPGDVVTGFKIVCHVIPPLELYAVR